MAGGRMNFGKGKVTKTPATGDEVAKVKSRLRGSFSGGRRKSKLRHALDEMREVRYQHFKPKHGEHALGMSRKNLADNYRMLRKSFGSKALRDQLKKGVM